MKLVKKTDEYTIFQRRDERYAVIDAQKRPVIGDGKVRILVAEELVKAAVPAAKPAEAESAAADEASVEGASSAAETTVEEDK